ncbi:MAG TPA: heat-inducible transcriptional repressor HrcA [Acidimicrobiia bacterium]|nr:heat-inducible transcriptional repressor HrcA [Acidimicrobiia bacterium]
MLEERRSDVLRALVEAHIQTGEPVSSRSILELTRMGVSAATIRNDLAVLERDGFVIQPHTSAGRIPTSRAYRYYVDQLGKGRLNSSNQARIAGFFSSVQLGLSNLLKATSQLLADVTHYPAVVVGPGTGGEIVRALHLVMLGTQASMVVVVTDRGRVTQQQVRLDLPISIDDLAEAERLLTPIVVGREPGKLGDHANLFAGRSEAVCLIGEAVLGFLERAASLAGEIYVGGTRQMTELWDSVGAVHRVLEVLEREAEVLNLLAHASGVSIRIGTELPVSEDVDLAVVSATYEAGGSEGSIGVIGPMRMDYKTAISAVERVGRELEDRIGS